MKDSKYEKCIKEWDKIFKCSSDTVPSKIETGCESLDKGLVWLSQGTEKVLDFGCGNGTILFLMAQHGTEYNYGIDLSEQAIAAAQKRSLSVKDRNFRFIKGGIDSLKDIESDTFDAVVLSNVIDNLYKEDAEKVLSETYRILKTGGKVLVKLNPYISEDEIKNQKITRLDEDMLDDGFLVLNKTTDEWTQIFEKNFNIVKFEDIYFDKYKQFNRMFLMIKEN